MKTTPTTKAKHQHVHGIICPGLYGTLVNMHYVCEHYVCIWRLCIRMHKYFVWAYMVKYKWTCVVCAVCLCACGFWTLEFMYTICINVLAFENICGTYCSLTPLVHGKVSKGIFETLPLIPMLFWVYDWQPHHLLSSLVLYPLLFVISNSMGSATALWQIEIPLQWNLFSLVWSPRAHIGK